MEHNWGQCVSEFKINLGSVGQFGEGNLDIDNNSTTRDSYIGRTTKLTEHHLNN